MLKRFLLFFVTLLFSAQLLAAGKPFDQATFNQAQKDGKPILVVGSPGGSRIISTVMQVIVNTLDFDMNIAAAVAAPRLHHQWLPDEVRIERGFPLETLEALRAKGHKIVEPLGQTSANSIAVSPDGILGAPDPRSRGSEAAGY